MNIGVLLSESLIYLVQNGAWALVFLDPSQVRMCRQCWKILQLKKLGETILRPVLLRASSVTLDPHFVELRVVNEKSLVVWKHWFVDLFPAYIYFFLRTWKFWWRSSLRCHSLPIAEKYHIFAVFKLLFPLQPCPWLAAVVLLYIVQYCALIFLTLGPHLFVLFQEKSLN